MTVARSVYALQVAGAPTDVYGLVDNAWAPVTLVASQRYIPRSATPATVLESQSDPVSREFGGIHYGSGKIFYFGGGHGGYAGNDVEVYDVTNKVWTQSYNPDICDPNDTSCNVIYQGGPSRTLSPNSRPYTEHTFEKFAWNPATQRLMAILGTGTFAYDPVAKTWTIVAPLLEGADIRQSNLLQFDADLQTTLGILTETSGTGQTAGIYQIVSGAWSRITSVPQLSGAAYGVYLPDQHKHFVLFTNNESYYLFDAVALAWTAIASPPDWIDSFDYDTIHHRVIGVQYFDPAIFKVFAYNPATDTWTQLASPSVWPPQVGGGPHAWTPLLRYDPINNVFIFLKATGGAGNSGGTTETWAYRYQN